jgi:hypothetical protein
MIDSREVFLTAEGKNTEIAVPLRTAPSVLRIVMLPPCFSTIPFTTHSPSPFPFSGFVVKKGSKILERFALGMPHPLSPIVSQTVQLWASCPDKPHINRT